MMAKKSRAVNFSTKTFKNVHVFMLLGIFLLCMAILLLYVNGIIEKIFPSEEKIVTALTFRQCTKVRVFSHTTFKLHLSSTECITTSLWLFYPLIIPSFEKRRSRPTVMTLMCILYSV